MLGIDSLQLAGAILQVRISKNRLLRLSFLRCSSKKSSLAWEVPRPDEDSFLTKGFSGCQLLGCLCDSPQHHVLPPHPCSCHHPCDHAPVLHGGWAHQFTISWLTPEALCSRMECGSNSWRVHGAHVCHKTPPFSAFPPLPYDNQQY